MRPVFCCELYQIGTGGSACGLLDLRSGSGSLVPVPSVDRLRLLDLLDRYQKNILRFG